MSGSQITWNFLLREAKCQEKNIIDPLGATENFSHSSIDLKCLFEILK